MCVCCVEEQEERVRHTHNFLDSYTQSRLRKPTFVGECGEFEALGPAITMEACKSRVCTEENRHTLYTEFPVHFVHPLPQFSASENHAEKSFYFKKYEYTHRVEDLLVKLSG